MNLRSREVAYRLALAWLIGVVFFTLVPMQEAFSFRKVCERSLAEPANFVDPLDKLSQQNRDNLDLISSANASKISSLSFAAYFPTPEKEKGSYLGPSTIVGRAMTQGTVTIPVAPLYVDLTIRKDSSDKRRMADVLNQIETQHGLLSVAIDRSEYSVTLRAEVEYQQLAALLLEKGVRFAKLVPDDPRANRSLQMVSQDPRRKISDVLRSVSRRNQLESGLSQSHLVQHVVANISKLDMTLQKKFLRSIHEGLESGMHLTTVNFDPSELTRQEEDFLTRFTFHRYPNFQSQYGHSFSVPMTEGPRRLKLRSVLKMSQIKGIWDIQEARPL